jgi:hypothetical protein
MPNYDPHSSDDFLSDLATLLNSNATAVRGMHSGASEPTETVAYMFWADTTNAVLKMRNSTNTDWVTVGTLDTARLGLLPVDGSVAMSGNLAFANSYKLINLAAGSSDNDSIRKVQALLRDGSQAMLAALNMGGFRITNGATPLSGTDLATKNYVDNRAATAEGQFTVGTSDTEKVTLSFQPKQLVIYPYWGTGSPRPLLKGQLCPINQAGTVDQVTRTEFSGGGSIIEWTTATVESQFIQYSMYVDGFRIENISLNTLDPIEYATQGRYIAIG